MKYKITILILLIIILCVSLANAGVIEDSLFRAEKTAQCGADCWEDGVCPESECNALEGCEMCYYECITEEEGCNYNLKIGQTCSHHDQCETGYCSHMGAVSDLQRACCPEGSDWTFEEYSCLDSQGNVVAYAEDVEEEVDYTEEETEEDNTPISCFEPIKEFNFMDNEISYQGEEQYNSNTKLFYYDYVNSDNSAKVYIMYRPDLVENGYLDIERIEDEFNIKGFDLRGYREQPEIEGFIYFELKKEESKISYVSWMFENNVYLIEFDIDKVIAKGEHSNLERDGEETKIINDYIIKCPSYLDMYATRPDNIEEKTTVVNVPEEIEDILDEEENTPPEFISEPYSEEEDIDPTMPLSEAKKQGKLKELIFNILRFFSPTSFLNSKS